MTHTARRIIRTAIGIAACVMLGTRSGWACPVCFGAVDSPMTDGMNWGIFVLLGVIGAVACGFVTFFVHLFRQARTRAGNGMMPGAAPQRGSY